MGSRKPPRESQPAINHAFKKSQDLIPSQNPFNGPNSVYDRNGGIIVRTIVHLDPDSDLFMKVAQRAYQDHERSLVPCLKCGRKFFPDRIETHERNCAATKLTDPKEPAENSLGEIRNHWIFQGVNVGNNHLMISDFPCTQGIRTTVDVIYLERVVRVKEFLRLRLCWVFGNQVVVRASGAVGPR
ncbi:unnamed protein product [Allacma fusca]|uniref:C2HC/C3H-type domain-containing protein n=1 Tax=Allacma fusca TaxID=39272 RepID=A0A8J2KN48_9HEXA|nr:unnamed protein product [Allacma fusca]